MEKICLARRKWENGKVEEKKPEPALTFRCSSEPTATIEPSESVNALIDHLITMDNEEESEEAVIARKFELQIKYERPSPVNITVYVTPANGKNSKRWLTVEETAQTLRVSKDTIYKGLRSGKLNGLKVGRQWRTFMAALYGKVKEEKV